MLHCENNIKAEVGWQMSIVDVTLSENVLIVGCPTLVLFRGGGYEASLWFMKNI